MLVNFVASLALIACWSFALRQAQGDTVSAQGVTYQIDLERYFPSAEAEAQRRRAVIDDAKAFAGAPMPTTAADLLRRLERYDALLKRLERHDIYVYLRAEENDEDNADAKADDELGEAEDLISDRVVETAQKLGAARIHALTSDPLLRPYRFLLMKSLAQGAHRLTRVEARSVALTVTPVLDTAAATYRALRKSNVGIESNQEAYAALLVSIASARNGVGRLRGFDGAAQASYFDKSIDPASVERTLQAIRESRAYAGYLNVAAKAPKSGFTPPRLAVADAIALILAAEKPMGAEYAGAFAALLNPANRRLEICTAPQCDDTGFSVGFAGLESGVYYGGYDGDIHRVRAIAHESGHAVHREFMSRYQPIAAYNLGPSFMFESFAIFNELLFLNYLYEGAATDAQRAYYLNYFLDNATFQVFGSAEETELESAIYYGVDDGSIKTAADFNALTTKVFSRYDPASVNDPTTRLYWARDRLFFTDPLYDVSYLYAGLLALAYFADFERDSKAFAPKYVALLKNGFDDTPVALERRFLGIDLSNERALVANAADLIGRRTDLLSKLYSAEASSR
jgi:oligoendopeptidase F